MVTFSHYLIRPVRNYHALPRHDPQLGEFVERCPRVRVDAVRGGD
jgi:hypothetical protein